ncbi:MAG TPA: GNAT family N-acetyltransferase [Steroidobacteraceae bacterium]|jgi:GNAT superfamily N-acetyltransferase|nr:GNAT family N-acetyltransferase [Steroidobacteraceae bacterium]
MTSAAIRKAKPSDISELFDLLRAKAKFDGALDALTATPEELCAALFCDSPNVEVVVAEKNGTLVGFATYYAIFSTYSARPGLWMDDLFVDEAQRSCGIGRELLRFLAREATSRKACKLEWSLQTSNSRGIAFYKREGAVIREINRFAKLDEAGLARLLA